MKIPGIMKAHSNIFQIGPWVNKHLNIISSVVFLFLGLQELSASHIVGGQISYRHLHHTYYEVTVVVRRDCINGADTVPFDNPAIIGVFYGDYQKAFRVGDDGTYRFAQTVDDTLNETIDNVCLGKFDRVCVHQTIYRDTINLPLDDRGYYLVYQRCCRNNIISNIIDPTETGATFSVFVPSLPLNPPEFNSSPQWGDWPPIYTCTNLPFEFNHSAIDPDGDSLVYSFCTPYSGKTKLDPAGRPDNPPYDTINWKPNFGLQNLIGAPFSIDAKTGIIKGQPNLTGHFLVGVCVSEYRKGRLLTFTRRDFELTVVACGIKPDVDFIRKSNLCDGLRVQFENTTKNGMLYFWYFDFANNKNVNSTDKDPVFTYSKEGTYEVVLVAKNGDCDDTTRHIIKVIDPQVHAAFKDSLTCDSLGTLYLIDQSSSRYNIISREWTIFGRVDSFRSSDRNPIIKLKRDGFYEIGYIITDENGCTSKTTSQFNFKFVNIDLNASDTSICVGDSIRLVKNPDPRLHYTWSPTNSLNLSDPSNPIAKPSQSTTYSVTISDGPCSVVKEIKVHVKQKIPYKITGDTLSCDGMITLHAQSDSTTLYTWSYNPNFDPAISMDSILKIKIENQKRIYFKVGKANQCGDTISLLVSSHEIDISHKREYEICAGDSLEIQIFNNKPSDTLTIKWLDNPIIIGPKDQLKTILHVPNPGRFVIYFETKNKYNCTESDSIIITAINFTTPDIQLDNDCGSLTIKVSTNSKGKIHWDFGDGAGQSNASSTSYTYSKPGKYTITLQADSICTRINEITVTVVELRLELQDTIISCNGEPVALNPGGSSTYLYEWSPTEGLDNPKSSNPIATVTTSRWYYVRIVNPDFPDLCDLRDSIYVFIPPTLHVTAFPDTTLCQKSKIQLHATSNQLNVEYQWCDLQNKPIGSGMSLEIDVDSSSRFFVKIKDKYGCSEKDTVDIVLYTFNGTIEGPEVICKGDTAKLIAKLLPSSTQFKLLWGPQNLIIGSVGDSCIFTKPDKSSTYTLSIDNSKGCTWDLDYVLDVNDIQSSLNVTVTPSIVVAGQSTQLFATYNPKWTYKWVPQDGLNNPNIHNPVATPIKTTSYTVMVTDEAGCTGTATVHVIVQSCPDAVFLPNAFSPNNDSKNDELCVRTRPGTLTKMELIIYNRWGEKVFETSDPGTCWDGTYKNSKLSPDVFGYLLKYSCVENQEFIKKGNISLLK